jgi:hypothetical protein
MTGKPASRHRPVVTLVVSLHLRADIETALGALRNIADDDHGTLQMVNDLLHGALAHIAAKGETCLLAPVVNAVHDAERHLEACHPAQATASLNIALSHFARPSTHRTGPSGRSPSTKRCMMAPARNHSAETSEPQVDQNTAESMEEDADFADEHTRPTFADEDSPEGAADESVPEGEGGMDMTERRRPE